MIEAEFLHSPLDKGMFCHCPSILETHSGTILIVWYSYPEDEYANATLVLATKSKNQSKWMPGKPILESGKYSAGNPVLFQEPGGRIHLLYVVLKGTYWNDACLQGAYSDDEGLNWSNPVQLWPTLGMMVRHPPVLLDSGSFLLPAYDERTRQSILLSSDSPHSKWKEAYRFHTPDIIQPAIVKGNDGKLTLLFRPFTDPRFAWVSHSKDQGKTWSEPNTTSLPNPLSGISAFQDNGKLVVIYNHTEDHQRWPLSASLSTNGGIRWENVKHIDEVQLEVSYPSFILGQNNIVHGAYTYNRRMIKYVKFGKNSLT